MDIKKIIKKSINEVAGISFEVREWAKILSDEITRLVNEADEAEVAKQPKKDVVEPQVTSYGENTVSHFEDLEGKSFDHAIVPADELFYDPKTIQHHPEIVNVIKGKTIKVTFDRWGLNVKIDGTFDRKYEEVLEDMVSDHMNWGQSLYDDNFNEVIAVIDTKKKGMSKYGGYYGYDDFYGGGYSSYIPKVKAKIERLVINGRDFPESYKKFSVDKWIFIDATRIEYDHYNSGYSEDTGEYEVYFNVPIRGLSMSMFTHEIKHAYDDWNRMRNGGKPIRDSWEIKNIYTKDFEKLILGGKTKYPQLGSVIGMYYLGSKLETPAYLENEFDSPMAGTYRETSKRLINFKAERFYNKKGQLAKGLEEEFTDILINYNIPFFRKFKDVGEFLKYTEKYFNKRGRDIMKRIDKTMYIHGKTQPKQSYTPPVSRPEGKWGELPF